MDTRALYVHIPFCDQICSYCDFCKTYYNETSVDNYLEVLKSEIKSLNIKELDSIYIGGGTPSSLNDDQLEYLLTILKPYSHNLKEYCIEVNPESMDYYKLKILKQFNINRLSIGVQTFNQNILHKIERHHNKTQVLSLINNATKVGIDNISIDLMYGLPHQTIDDIKEDLRIVASLPIKHISYYSLILEDHTVLKNAKYQPLDEEDEYKINLLIDEQLKKLGYHKYEISNYAKDGYESYHNKVYWHYENYYGVGIGASGKIDNCIYDHSRSLTKYLQRIDIVTKNEFSVEDVMFNNVMMSLRLVEGLDIEVFNQRYQVDVLNLYASAIQKHLNNGNMIIENNHLRVTNLYLLNEILLDFMS